MSSVRSAPTFLRWYHPGQVQRVEAQPLSARFPCTPSGTVEMMEFSLSYQSGPRASTAEKHFNKIGVGEPPPGHPRIHRTDKRGGILARSALHPDEALLGPPS